MMRKNMIRVLLVTLILIQTSCHPFSVFWPKRFDTFSNNLELPSASSVQIAVDEKGIPFIRARETKDALFGLGYMHARDRLFQLDLIRHASQGRLAELFKKKDLLSTDRLLRLMTYKIDEQIKNIDSAELVFLKSYCDGVNQSAKENGRSAEHFLLGTTFEEFTVRDVVTIARLQAWQLASDVVAELVRLKIARSSLNEAAKKAMLASVDDRGVAVIRGHYNKIDDLPFAIPNYPRAKKISLRDQPSTLGATQGASNAWAVHKNVSKEGMAFLMNDPHLRHNWPSNFYLAGIESDDVNARGASFVGLPAILIGASDTMAWGVTASYLNNQDSVLLKMSEEEENTYIVDGQKHRFEKVMERFCFDKQGTCIEEAAYNSIFGPVVDHSFDSLIDEGDRFALMWTAHLVNEHRAMTSQFLHLAQAKNVPDAVKVASTMTLPGVNLTLADTQGNIGYAYAGIVGKRDPSQHPYLPLDGSRSSSRWSGVLKINDEPKVINPEEGYLVNANQNVYSHGGSPHKAFAYQGAPPFRALRINERIGAMLQNSKKIDFDELASIQKDDTSVEALELAAGLGKLCVEEFKADDADRQSFARDLAGFDGQYRKDSFGALPYDLLLKRIISARFLNVFDDKMLAREFVGEQIKFAIKSAVRKQLGGEKTAIFSDLSERSNGFESFIGQQCRLAYDDMASKYGAARFKRRWGKVHYLKRQSPLAQAPLIGAFFRDFKREMGGSPHSPTAARGLPVTHGASLRFVAKLSDPIDARFVLDSGNSGLVGNDNAFDQVSLWHEGKTIGMPANFEEAKKRAKYFKVIGN